MAAKTRDMTSGNPTRLILSFCLPIMAGNLFQQLYSLVDTLVIGQIEGVTALAAVSAAGWLDWLVLGLAQGMAQGFSIQIAQSFGAGDYAEMRRAAGQSILLSVGIVAVLTALAQPFLVTVSRSAAWASIGLTTTAEATTADELRRQADLALYVAKGAGKGRWRGYHATCPPP